MIRAMYHVQTVNGLESVTLPLIFKVEVLHNQVCVTSAHGATLQFSCGSYIEAMMSAAMLRQAVDDYWWALYYEEVS